MYKKQLEATYLTGIEMLEKAKHCSKADDTETFVQLGLKLLAESRNIAREMQLNSAFLFIECASRIDLNARNYVSYLEFCARNGLETISQTDFNTVCDNVKMPEIVDSEPEI